MTEHATSSTSRRDRAAVEVTCPKCHGTGKVTKPGPKWNGRCTHAWREKGPAPDFQGMKCVLWMCDFCNKEWELFEGSLPSGAGSVIVDD